MEKKVKEQIINSVDSIKFKLRQMRDQEDQDNIKLSKVFKPITEPLHSLIKAKNSAEFDSNDIDKSCSNLDETGTIVNTSNSSEYQDFDDSSEENKKTESVEFNSLPELERSLKKEEFAEICEGVDIPFGIRRNNNKIMLGNMPVTFSKVDSGGKEKDVFLMRVDIDNNVYKITPGLKELLFRKKPDLQLISDKDKLIYKNILLRTNAHKRDYNPTGQIKGDKGVKYREIIKPMFFETGGSQIIKKDEVKFGGNLPKLKMYKRNTDLVYWDDPNELVERLKLLIASRDAGNSNHDNEILSIIEELKEANIIKE